jgi:hypothetical protein
MSKKIPTHDPQTGDTNPYYEELTGGKNPMWKESHKEIKIDSEKVIKVEPKMIRENFEHPNPKKHQQISFIKSGVRIIGYGIIPFNLVIASSVLILSEIIGIIEELV